jgi:hypothetical protein
MGQPDIVVEMAKPYLDIVAFSRSTYYFSGIQQFADGNQILKFYVGYYHWERHQCHHQLFLIWDLDFS